MKAILCFGDSITFGRGEQPCLSWPGRLKKYFEPKDYWNCVYNLGVPGEISKDLLERFETEAKARTNLRRSESGCVIIISIGLNDTRWDGLPEENKPRVTEEEFNLNIKKLIEKAKSYQKELVFIGLTPVDEKKTLPFETTSFKNERVKQFNEITKKNCEENNVLFLDIFDKLNTEDWPEMLADGVHPNSKGYDKMYELVKEFSVEKDFGPIWKKEINEH